MKLGLHDAAKLTGKHTSTITRAHKAGRLTVEQDGSGRHVYDVAELERVFGPLKVPAEQRSATQAAESSATQQMLQRVQQERIEGLEREIRRLEGTLEDTRSDRDQWRQQATALLTDQRPTPASQPPKGFWRWLRGRS